MQLGHRGNAEPGIGTGEYDRAFFRKAPVFRTGYRWRLRRSTRRNAAKPASNALNATFRT